MFTLCYRILEGIDFKPAVKTDPYARQLYSRHFENLLCSDYEKYARKSYLKSRGSLWQIYRILLTQLFSNIQPIRPYLINNDLHGMTKNPNVFHNLNNLAFGCTLPEKFEEWSSPKSHIKSHRCSNWNHSNIFGELVEVQLKVKPQFWSQTTSNNKKYSDLIVNCRIWGVKSSVVKDLNSKTSYCLVWFTCRRHCSFVVL